MSTAVKTLEAIRQLKKYPDKSGLLYALIESFSFKSIKLSSEDSEEIAVFLFEEIETLIRLIPEAQNYKEKDFMFEYEGLLRELATTCHISANAFSQDQRDRLDLLGELIKKEKYLENMVKEVFGQKKNDPDNVRYLLAMMDLTKDEYHKCRYYLGLLHYQELIVKLPEESRDLIGDHMRSEMIRYIENPLTNDKEANLELICDLCHHFGKERFETLLKQALWIGNSDIRFYDMGSMIILGCEVPDVIIKDLAHDLEYAFPTYALLKKNQMEDRFPDEYNDAPYLAQSDFCRWLMFPTELGTPPDEIEYVGRFKNTIFRKKGLSRKNGGSYYIFRFRSTSENLESKLRGEWLIGWSGPYGATFSNYALYSDYDKGSMKKTLKYIKKTLF